MSGSFDTSYDLSFDIGTGGIPGYGDPGAATFILDLEPGAKVTLGWGTEIFKSSDGTEQRCNTTGPAPRQRFEGSAFLLDDADRGVRTALQRAAAAGSTFLLALPYEDLLIAADAVGTIVTMETTSVDWALPGQRCILAGPDGTSLGVVVQSVSSTTIVLAVVDASGELTSDTSLGLAGHAGARLMPAVQILLDPQQGFARYQVNAGTWSIRAKASIFGWTGIDSMGRGAQIVTYGAGAPLDPSAITDSDIPIWDRPNFIDGTSSETMMSLTEVIDLGGAPFAAGGADTPDWARPIRFSSARGRTSEWQWLKAFLHLVRGRQRPFLLSTGRADLAFVSASDATLTVSSSVGDYITWYASLAHRWLALSMSDGSTLYVAVVSEPIDNEDGTLTLTLDIAVVGTVTRISFLELVRFDNNDNDDFPILWDGAVFSVDLIARTTEDLIVPSALMYDTFLNATFTVATTAELVFAAGRTTYVKYMSGLGLTAIGAISVTSLGGAQDGMIVTISHENTPGAGAMTLAHEDTNWPAAQRIWLSAMTNRTGDNASFTFIYVSEVQRWVQIWGGTT